MGRTGRAVKGRRTYDASRRHERAREQRAATLDAARALFLEHGYVGTTVEAIAQAAGVSAATVYKTYGGKASLVRDLCQAALAGAGPVPAEERSNALRTADDPRRLVEGWGRLTAEVSPRVSPLLLLLRTASESDAEAARLYQELDRARLSRMADNARHLARSGLLRNGVTVNDARDVLWLCSSPELYDLLIAKRRWSRERFGRFITDTIAGSLI